LARTTATRADEGHDGGRHDHARAAGDARARTLAPTREVERAGVPVAHRPVESPHRVYRRLRRGTAHADPAASGHLPVPLPGLLLLPATSRWDRLLRPA